MHMFEVYIQQLNHIRTVLSAATQLHPTRSLKHLRRWHHIQKRIPVGHWVVQQSCLAIFHDKSILSQSSHVQNSAPFKCWVMVPSWMAGPTPSAECGPWTPDPTAGSTIWWIWRTSRWLQEFGTQCCWIFRMKQSSIFLTFLMVDSFNIENNIKKKQEANDKNIRNHSQSCHLYVYVYIHIIATCNGYFPKRQRFPVWSGGMKFLKEIANTMGSHAKLILIPSREITYPTLGKGKSSSKVFWDGIC